MVSLNISFNKQINAIKGFLYFVWFFGSGIGIRIGSCKKEDHWMETERISKIFRKTAAAAKKEPVEDPYSFSIRYPATRVYVLWKRMWHTRKKKKLPDIVTIAPLSN